MILPLASIGGCQLIRIARGRPSRLITVRSLGEELGAVSDAVRAGEKQRKVLGLEGWHAEEISCNFCSPSRG